MIDVIVTFLELLLSIIGILILFTKALGCRFNLNRGIPFAISILFLFSLCFFISNNTVLFLISFFTYLFSLISISFVVTSINWKKRLFIIILYQAISYVFVSTVSLITKFFIQNNYVEKATDILVNLALVLCVIFIPKKFISEKLCNLISFTSKGIKIYIIALMYCLSLTALIIAYLPRRTSYNIWYLLLFVFVAMLIIAVLLLPLLISNNISKNFYKRINQLENAQIQTQKEYSRKLLENSIELRKFKHNHKNQLIVLQSYLDKNNIVSAKEYIKNSSEYINSLEGYKTGNYILDALLDEKSKKSYLYNTIIKCSGNFVQYSLDDIDLCIIFGNAIDNAIEACEKIHTTEPKIISIIIKQQNHILNVLITNPVSEPPIIEDNMIVTIKSDKENHGFGLYSIKRTIQKYKGLCEISCKDNIFSINITLSIE